MVTPLADARVAPQLIRSPKIMTERISISLNPRERILLFKYAYPFEQLELQLKENKKFKNEREISADEFEWNQAVGNIAISMNEDIDNEMLLEELESLASLIEFEIGKYG